VLYFNVNLLSTFYKVKSENNLSDGSFNLGHPSHWEDEGLSQPLISLEIWF
jgi:hypothetical protein